MVHIPSLFLMALIYGSSTFKLPDFGHSQAKSCKTSYTILSWMCCSLLRGTDVRSVLLPGFGFDSWFSRGIRLVRKKFEQISVKCAGVGEEGGGQVSHKIDAHFHTCQIFHHRDTSAIGPVTE